MNARGWLVVSTSLFVTTACSGGSGTSSADLVGTWNVTKYELVSTASSATKLDLISLGGTATLVMKSDGTYQMTTKLPGEPDEIVTGTWSAGTDVLTTTRVDRSGNMQFDYALSGSTLTLAGANTDWDFNGDDVSEPAKLNVTAVRR